MDHSHLIVEQVPCCVCGSTGKVPKWRFWKRDCNVCQGTGHRSIVMDRLFPDDIKAMVRQDATYGLNRFGLGYGNSAANSLFGGLF